ncbi:sugar phosphate nucleotidyltransferase [Schinkia azotoformans]|uniref:Mannose-6-phosphate isomerase n=1 Tax=Schinkia azotoformans LMG 9581 TaxID=1131731 RepID=K6CVB9_SCHAZ|nr:sugar phosphate nucleotidyltransferase [Schinkia azotoformans]EKN64172.1 mannose-6-phosphate isomerase [Schinkia azotoformans LMG 9581]MEC1639569.1 sugar phosphate nucleotidyltransferase [Schinkia azotoformans]MEC1722263.1 sugar phosphate nucleotidyltransferase [Schinkia azotoformans]MEC1944687.1 sugar phosphate nucleotidyltransferase [Schinkia azotoformans]MED4414641.1 sugar phosphate nucleotidyltransferase [Schinkia azotoformans]
MQVVLLSGGSGKRLWPLSNETRSKQFLKVLQDSEGKNISMVQRVWGQLINVGLASQTIIATSKSQVDILQNQLSVGPNSLVIEPSRRDTFAAIALASTYLYSVKGICPDEVVIVLPVDAFVENSFFERMKELEDIILHSNANLALLGVKPTYSSTKYGYIIPEKVFHNDSAIPFLASEFIEKPNESTAERLIEKGALWNCGVFAFKLSYLQSILQENNLPIHYNELLKQYNEIPCTSFDYAVVEKENKIATLPYEEDWKDIGTWNTLTEEMNSKIIGKGNVSQDSVNTHLINELDIPIAILGITDAIVAASPDGILVSSKAKSSNIKSMTECFDDRPMYEERRWGWYKVLDYVKFDDGNEVITKRLCIAKGKNISYQIHLKRSEVWTVVKGTGEFIKDDELMIVGNGDVLVIPIGTKHGIKAITDLEIIEVQSGSELSEDDIVRYCETWDEIKAHYNELHEVSYVRVE